MDFTYLDSFLLNILRGPPPLKILVESEFSSDPLLEPPDMSSPRG